MEIVIENQVAEPANPSLAVYPYPTLHRPAYRSLYGAVDGSTQSSSGYYGSLSRQRGHQSPVSDYDSLVNVSVRRVDKSGLLEMPDLEPAATQLRHLTGAESSTATLTRRVDRSGLLEAVPEVPDQCQIYQPSAERHLTGAEISVQEAKLSSGNSNEAQQPSSLSPRSSSNNKLEARTHTNKCGVIETSLDLSPTIVGNDKCKDSGITRSAIPDVIEAHGTTNSSKVIIKDEKKSGVLEEQRAEAEGCEHTIVRESSEDSRTTFKDSKKLLHNDNIQTLRVIILSEQL